MAKVALSLLPPANLPVVASYLTPHVCSRSPLPSVSSHTNCLANALAGPATCFAFCERLERGQQRRISVQQQRHSLC